MSIERFRGEYFFLSNMYRLSVPIQAEVGLLVPTSEHAYQSAKFLDPVAQMAIASLEKGIDTKTLAHELEAKGEQKRPDWQTIKVGVMHAIVRQKFILNPDIAMKLVETGDEELIEGNDWGDHFWGVDPVGTRNGQNQLGKILMDLRTELAS